MYQLHYCNPPNPVDGALVNMLDHGVGTVILQLNKLIGLVQMYNLKCKQVGVVLIFHKSLDPMVSTMVDLDV